MAGADTAIAQYEYPLLKGDYFLSYFYKKNTEKALTLKPANYVGDIIVDSGAHSFFGAYGLFDNVSYQKDTAKRASLKEIEEYFEKYIDWVRVWYDKIGYYAELDLQEIVGMARVMEWRKRLIKAGLGSKLITCVHYGDTWQDFKWMLDNTPSRYVATQGIRQGKANIDHKKFIREAYQERVRIHGFAMTKREVMEGLPFYSVDSSSWLSVYKFGTIFKFDGSKIRRIANNPQSKSRLMKHGVGLENLGHARSKEETRQKLINAEYEWREYEKYLVRLWEARGICWKERLLNHRSS